MGVGVGREVAGKRDLRSQTIIIHRRPRGKGSSSTPPIWHARDETVSSRVGGGRRVEKGGVTPYRVLSPGDAMTNTPKYTTGGHLWRPPAPSVDMKTKIKKDWDNKNHNHEQQVDTHDLDDMANIAHAHLWLQALRDNWMGNTSGVRRRITQQRLVHRALTQ